MYGVNLSLDELLEAILQGRKSGHAGSARKVDHPQRPGFKEFLPFVFVGNWQYLDSYAGHYYAPGQEVVRFKGLPVWNMAYNGGMLQRFHGDVEKAKNTFRFLKLALLKGIEERRFARGPKFFMDNVANKGADIVYMDELVGDITRFKGTETIYFNGNAFFSQDYIGGLIVHK